MEARKIIKGLNCSLVRFKNDDEKLVELIYKLFNDKGIAEYLNPDYLNYKAKFKIRKWIKMKSDNPVEVWYLIKAKRDYIGYVCFKWRKHYDEACEISTAIVNEFRGLKLGYESSKILIEYILSLEKFKYIAGYVHYKNPKAANNLRKVGFQKAQHLHKTITVQFYNDDGTSTTGRKYILYVIYAKSKSKIKKVIL
ncbi:MAG: GNAT family N-acetyltransferase [Bacteroidota bacterium]|nr:GNAT family N-acetyltransferase [Bacteroidota bacterium]